jgi:hypothetical protein
LVGGGSFCGDWGVFALVMDFKEVSYADLTPELAHWGGDPSGKFFLCKNLLPGKFLLFLPLVSSYR